MVPTYLPGCYEVNISYGRENHGIMKSFENITDFLTCQSKCQDVTTCSHWSFDTIKHTCDLSDNDNRRRWKIGVISGTKYCWKNPGKHPSFLELRFIYIFILIFFPF